MKTARILSAAFAILAVFALANPLQLNAQQGQATAIVTGVGTANSTADANAVITSPQLVSELHGTVQVKGTANVTGMHSYFLETRELNPDASLPSSDTPWVPATLPSSTPVTNGVLASWDTTLVPDGLYELRLTVTTNNALSTYFVVTPLRIGNAAYVSLTAAPTSAVSGVPTVTANLSANVRSGDSIYFPVIGYLTRNSSASVLGVSSTGSGWFYIQLSDGSKGWISPDVVTKSGDFSTLPVVTPPPALPVLTATSLPQGLLVNGIALNPATPTCNVAFNVAININNPAKTASVADKVYIHDVNQTTGTVTSTAIGAIPALDPGANYVVTVPLTVTTYYGVVHQVQATVDGSQITTTYTLAQGQCNISNPPTGVPTSATSATTPASPVPTTAVPTTAVPATPTMAASATVVPSPTK